MTDSERELLFYIARMLALRADPAGSIAPEMARLLTRAQSGVGQPFNVWTRFTHGDA